MDPNSTAAPAHVLNDLEPILRRHLTLLAADAELAEDADLAELGLDSMTAINLMLDLEQGFGVRFPDEMLDPEVFRSPRRLAEAIHALLAA
jgi:acyl carrier protein